VSYSLDSIETTHLCLAFMAQLCTVESLAIAIAFLCSLLGNRMMWRQLTYSTQVPTQASLAAQIQTVYFVDGTLDDNFS